MPVPRLQVARVLSALVVKGSFFLIVRLWFDAMPGLLTMAAAQLLATLGAAAILFGSVLALRQQRLKLLIAYSTIAQIGYLFFLFPLGVGLAGSDASGAAWTGGWLQLFSHAFAKAAMFMAAGLIRRRSARAPSRRIRRWAARPSTTIPPRQR
jgi:multicomponent Na+:H+ antiporter subunit D